MTGHLLSPSDCLENGVHVFFRFRDGPVVGPIGQALCHFKRLFVAGQFVLAQQAGHDLVDGVEGRPNRFARIQVVEPFGWERTQIPAGQLRLRFGEIVEHLVALCFNLLVARRGVHERCRRKVVQRSVRSCASDDLPPSAARTLDSNPALAYTGRLEHVPVS